MPAVLVDGARVEWTDLQPALTEAAGGLVLEEMVLQRALQAECERRGLSVTDDAAEAERRLLGQALAAAANVPESESETLIARVRLSRGLGDVRFGGLLKRNAMLRALVRSEKLIERVAPVTDDDVRQAYTLKYGPRVRARVILLRSESLAGETLRRLRGEGRPAESFAEVAAEVSVDPSAQRGGQLDPFSLDDANYPVAVRRVLAQLEPGIISEPVAVSWGNEQGYAIVRLDARVPPPEGTPAAESCREELRIEVRLVRERAAMDRLARRLVAEAKVTIFDRTLDRSWQERSGAAGK